MFDDKYNGISLDDAATEAGGYVAYSPGKRMTIDYDIRELSKYCRERNIEPIDLPEDELKLFEISSPRVYQRVSASI